MSFTPDESIELQRERYQSILQNLSEAPKFTEEWFRLKEEELSLRGLMAAETTAPRRAADGSKLHAPSKLTGSIESIPNDTDHPLPYPNLQWSMNPGAKEQIDYEAIAAKKDAVSGSTQKISSGTHATAMKGKPVAGLSKQPNSNHAKNMKDDRYLSISDDSLTSAPELRDSNLQSTAIANSRFIGYSSDVPTRPVPENSDIVVTEAFPVTDEIICIDVPPLETAAIPSAEVVVLDMYSVTIAGRKIHVVVLALAVLTLLLLIVGLSVYAALSNTNDSITISLHSSPSLSVLGEWAFCTSNSQYDNNCYSKEYSTSDGKYKCMPWGSQCTGI